MGRQRHRPPPLILDAGALVLVERGQQRARALLRRITEDDVPVVIPAGALAQAWRGGAGRGVLLARLLRRRHVAVEPLTEAAARAAGELLARSGTADVVDAHVVLVGARHGGVILTSDPEDLRALAPGVEIVAAR